MGRIINLYGVPQAPIQQVPTNQIPQQVVPVEHLYPR